MEALSLPPGSHYAVTWGLEEEHGGMTSAMLHRCRAFTRLTGTPVTVLTYDASLRHRAAEAALRVSGKLDDRISVRNLWDDLETWTDDELYAHAPCMASTDGAAFQPLTNAIGSPASPRVIRVNGDGPVRQSDYFRQDGTLLVSDRREGTGPRYVSLCDTRGRLIGTWHSAWGLYHCWLDTLPRDPCAYFIVDSKTSARHFSRYQGEGAVKVHVLHGSHLAGVERPFGPPNPEREFVTRNVASWDGFVFLTAQQRDDFAALHPDAENLHVCPNGREVPPELVNPRRESHRGAMLASLTEHKRVGHAVEALSLASRGRGHVLGGRLPHLDVYGSGDVAPLEELAARLVPTPSVRLHGYVANAHLALRDASFSLLTSVSEGQPLALIESMAAGCIPISYDIPYGPSDVITDGVDGFLVPAGDVEALADRIRYVATARPSRLERMRRAAHARALDFRDENTTRTWGPVLRHAAEWHRTRHEMITEPPSPAR